MWLSVGKGVGNSGKEIKDRHSRERRARLVQRQSQMTADETPEKETHYYSIMSHFVVFVFEWFCSF